MQHWSRSEYFDQTGLPWINPSPNLPNVTAATLYPGLGFLDFSNVSVGRGTSTRSNSSARLGSMLPRSPPHSPRATSRVTFAATTTTVAEDANHYPFHGQTIDAIRITVTDRNALTPPSLASKSSARSTISTPPSSSSKKPCASSAAALPSTLSSVATTHAPSQPPGSPLSTPLSLHAHPTALPITRTPRLLTQNSSILRIKADGKRRIPHISEDGTLPPFIVAFLLGLVAGLDAFVAPAAVSWAAYFGHFPVVATHFAFMGHIATSIILTCSPWPRSSM